MRYISDTDKKYYAYLLEFFELLQKDILDYKWLITDIEVNPSSQELVDLFSQHEAIILSTKNLIEYLNKEDFQWIWAVFSAIPKSFSDEEILKYKLPYARDNDEIYKDDQNIIQHPLAEIEIVAEDSSSIFLVTDKEEILNSFKKLYPNCKENY